MRSADQLTCSHRCSAETGHWFWSSLSRQGWVLVLVFLTSAGCLHQAARVLGPGVSPLQGAGVPGHLQLCGE